MANKVEAFGLRPYRSLNGSPWNNAQNRYTIADGYATAIFQGDLVKPVTGGNIERHAAGTSTAVVGVFNGVTYTDPTTRKPVFANYYPGNISSADITAFVIDDPDTVFLMNANGTFARSDIFQNYEVTDVTGNTDTGISKVELNVANSGTNASYMVRAIDISQDPSNSDVASADANVLVKINNHFYRETTGI
jgi:hypothetical protein